MPSSTFSSEARTPAALEPARWRRFFTIAIATAVGLGAAIYAFIAVIDPWDILPLSPPWKRAPMSTNQRYIYAALARSPKFDSVLVGTSTVRLLRPDALNAALGGRFANLSMNSATPYEQSRILGLFQRTHADIRTVVVGIDFRWCDEDVAKYGYRWNFPEWMYRAGQWRNYRHIFSLYALEEAFPQFVYLIGLRHARFGFDGYANFLPPDNRFDPVRTAAGLGPLPPRGQVEDRLRDDPTLRMPALERLRTMLAILPPTTRKLVLLTPTYFGNRPQPGTSGAAAIAACKFRIVQQARGTPNAIVVDFMIDSPITRTPSNYWDPLHYRVGIAERIVADLARATTDPRASSPDYRVLVP